MDDNDGFTQIIMQGMETLIKYAIIKELEEGLDEYIKEKEDKEDGNKILQC